MLELRDIHDCLQRALNSPDHMRGTMVLVRRSLARDVIQAIEDAQTVRLQRIADGERWSAMVQERDIEIARLLKLLRQKGIDE